MDETRRQELIADGATDADFEWQPFTKDFDYLKEFYDVMLPDGTVLKHFWPNAGKMNSMASGPHEPRQAQYTHLDNIKVRLSPDHPMDEPQPEDANREAKAFFEEASAKMDLEPMLHEAAKQLAVHEEWQFIEVAPRPADHPETVDAKRWRFLRNVDSMDDAGAIRLLMIESPEELGLLHAIAARWMTDRMVGLISRAQKKSTSRVLVLSDPVVGPIIGSALAVAAAVIPKGRTQYRYGQSFRDGVKEAKTHEEVAEIVEEARRAGVTGDSWRKLERSAVSRHRLLNAKGLKLSDVLEGTPLPSREFS